MNENRRIGFNQNALKSDKMRQSTKGKKDEVRAMFASRKTMKQK